MLDTGEEDGSREESVEDTAADLRWYAVSTRSRHEKRVRDRFTAIGIEPLLPLTSTLSQWSDRKAWTQVPLFSGYCFARFALANRLAILQTPGVVRIVGVLRPEAIPEEELAAISNMMTSGRPTESCSYLMEGAWVQVIHGPLAGLRGQLVRKGQQDGLVIKVRLIQQAALVHIDRRELRPFAESVRPDTPSPSSTQATAASAIVR